MSLFPLVLGALIALGATLALPAIAPALGAGLLAALLLAHILRRAGAVGQRFLAAALGLMAIGAPLASLGLGVSLRGQLFAAIAAAALTWALLSAAPAAHAAPQATMPQKTFWLICGAALLTGLALRAWHLGAPIATYHDIYAAEGIARSGLLLPQMESGTITFRAAPFAYLLAPFVGAAASIGFVGADFFAFIRLPMLALFVGTIVPMFLILAQLRCQTAAAVAAAVAAIFPLGIVYTFFDVRFFALLCFALAWSMYWFLRCAKTAKTSHFLLFVGFGMLAIFTEKPGILLAALSVVLFFMSSRRLLLFGAVSLATFVIGFFVAMRASVPILPPDLLAATAASDAATIGAAGSFSAQVWATKIAAISGFSPHTGFIEMLATIFPGGGPLAALAFFAALFALRKPETRPMGALALLPFAGVALLSAVEANTFSPRLLAFLVPMAPISVALGLGLWFRLAPTKWLRATAAAGMAASLFAGMLFFLSPISAEKSIPPALRTSLSVPFQDVHDLSLAADFVTDALQNRPNALLITTHSAAWESIHLRPHRADFILNTRQPQLRSTVLTTPNGLVSLYRGVPIIASIADFDALLAQTNRPVVLITNYDAPFRLWPKDIAHFQQNGKYQPFLAATSDTDPRVKVYIWEASARN